MGISNKNSTENQIIETKNKIIVAGIQVFCNLKKSEMLKKAELYMDRAYEQNDKIDLFVLPEQFYQLKCNEFLDEEYGEAPNQEFEEWVKRCSRKYNANIVAGSYAVKIDNGKIMNRCLVCNRNGEIVGFYDKIHLFDAFGIKESDTFSAGEELGLFDLDIGKIGVWICYDTRFPEISRALRMKGAEILCIPAAFYRPNTDQWEIIVKSSAIYNVTPVIAVNQYGDMPDGHGLFGRSMLVDSKGIINAGMSDKEGFFIGEIDKEYTKECRNSNPELNNRRVDLYKKWI